MKRKVQMISIVGAIILSVTLLTFCCDAQEKKVPQIPNTPTNIESVEKLPTKEEITKSRKNAVDQIQFHTKKIQELTIHVHHCDAILGYLNLEEKIEKENGNKDKK